MSTDRGSPTDPGRTSPGHKEGRAPEGGDATVLGYPSDRPAEPSPLPDVPVPTVRVRPPADSFDELLALTPESLPRNTEELSGPADPEPWGLIQGARKHAARTGQETTGVGDDGPATGIWQYAEPEHVPEGESSHIIANRYRIVEGLAVGGMGAVFKVKHLQLDRPFAMKLIHAGQATDPRLKKFFLREAQVLSRLQHPGIVSVTDFGSDPQHGFFLVMELLEGETLTRRLKGGGPLPAGQALVTAVQVAEALRYMHHQDLIHCDVKPDNVFLCREDEIAGRARQATLVDFGLSRPRAKGAQLAPSEVAGTPAFAAPEQITGSAPQATMDVYSVGALLWSMLAGEAPYGGTPSSMLYDKLDGPPEPPSNLSSHRIGQRLDDLVLRCMDPERGRRPSTMNNLVYELRTLLDMIGQTRPTRRTRTPTSRNRIPRPGELPSPTRSSVSLRDPCREITLPLMRLTPEARLADCGQAVCQLLGADRDTLRGQTLGETRLRHLYPELDEELASAVRDRNAFKRTLQYTSATGEQVTLVLWVVPQEDTQGQIARLWGVIVPL